MDLSTGNRGSGTNLEDSIFKQIAHGKYDDEDTDNSRTQSCLVQTEVLFPQVCVYTVVVKRERKRERENLSLILELVVNCYRAA